MSYIVLSDRVKEISYSIGTGNFALEGAVRGFASFGSAYADGDNLFYAITDGTDYEVGSGVYVTGVENQIQRFPLSTSNNNNLVDFESGLKEVFVTYPGSHSVYHASGYASAEAPAGSGIAFWLSSNVIGYDSAFIWDNTNNRIGINRSSPSYAIDLGGYGPDAIIRASGLIAGTSGVFFPEANNGDSGYLGGKQLVHFDPNDVLDVDAQTVIGVSGQVNQYIYLHEQPKGFVLAGPPSGCAGDCSPAVPQFRPLSLEDIPNLSSLYELAGVSGILRNALTDVSGIIISSGTQFISDLEAASGSLFSDIEGVSGDLLMVSGAMVVVSGMAAFDLAVSGILNNRLEEVSGIIISSGTQFISDLEAASGQLFNDILGVSGDLNTVSGIAMEALTSGVYAVENLGAGGGITLNDSMNATSGIVIASGSQFILDLEAASGTLFNDILGVSGDLNIVSGIAMEALTSGVYAIENLGGGGITLNDSMTATSGIVIASGTQFLNILQAASGVSNKLLVDLTGTENTAIIKNDDLGEPTHLRLNNTGGIGSRLLLSSSSGVDGNTWANVSLNDGAYRVYNYTYDWNIDVSGQPSSTEIILDSGVAWRELLPMSLVGASVSGTFLNNGHPSGVLIDSQYPASGHILTISAHPGQSLITSSPSLPEEVKIFSLGVNSIVATKENKFGLNLDPQAITSDLDIRGESVRIRNSGVITSASDAGYKGEIKWDENYIYVCVANNTWKRASLSTWP